MQFIGDVPWPPGGKDTKGSSGYPTNLDWNILLTQVEFLSRQTLTMLSDDKYPELLAKNLCGIKPEIEVDDKGQEGVKSPTGCPGATFFGDLTVLEKIEEKSKINNLKVYGNTPGIVVWERPRTTEKKNNAPSAGGSYYINMSTKVC